MAGIQKILIANRGEIAVRIMQTAQRMGSATVAIYSEVDSESKHVAMAGQAICLGHSALADTYLNIEKIIDTAIRTGCDAIHPGYGFLSENPELVAACEKAGIIFIGPSTRAMQVMGHKIEARDFVSSIGVPVTKGLTGDAATILENIGQLEFPVLVKAAAGGGGKGMRIVHSADLLVAALESTSREALSYFGDGTVYVEKFIEEPRHIEFQILGDKYGNVVHLFERECSIQRRYQKIVEEAPSPTLTPEIRTRMGEAAVNIGKAIGYNSAGTIEFLVDSALNFYFLEMNTRIQVEHPVTEMITGVDVVEEQIRIASGEKLRLKQEELSINGHAIECRIYAEDPANGFSPSPGRMTFYHEPSGLNIRVDSGISGNPIIPTHFDPMISKLILHAETRQQAMQQMGLALDNYIVQGVKTNISYLYELIRHEAFLRNSLSTKFCDLHGVELLERCENHKISIGLHLPVIACIIGTYLPVGNNSSLQDPWKAIGYWRIDHKVFFSTDDRPIDVLFRNSNSAQLEIEFERNIWKVSNWRKEGSKVKFDIGNDNHTSWQSQDEFGLIYINIGVCQFTIRRSDLLTGNQDFEPEGIADLAQSGDMKAPMPGRIVSIKVQSGDEVKKGDLMLILESMKMENNILSPMDGIIEKVLVMQGEMVDPSTRLIHFRIEEI
ncbi:MAG TPA: acetyl-CoA carboxylase biotin carboxylase subunit [Bacteroidales bacterium]